MNQEARRIVWQLDQPRPRFPARGELPNDGQEVLVSYKSPATCREVVIYEADGADNDSIFCWWPTPPVPSIPEGGAI